MKEKLSEQIIQGYSKLVQRLHNRVEDLIVENSVFSKDQVEVLEGALLGGVLISSILLIAGLVTRSPLLMAYGVIATGSMPGAMALVIASDEAFRANK